MQLLFFTLWAGFPAAKIRAVGLSHRNMLYYWLDGGACHNQLPITWSVESDFSLTENMIEFRKL
jgi:hypothetical protein